MVFILVILVIIMKLIVFYYLTTSVILKEIDIKSEKLKGEVKILHLTDFHFRRIGRLERNILKIREKLDPDLILFTGDWVNKGANFSEFNEFLKRLNIDCPAYTVLGNHDWQLKLHNYEHLKSILDNNNITLLRDEKKTLEVKNNRINLLGLEVREHGYEVSEDLLAEYKREHFGIVLAHTYDVVDCLEEAQYDLTLVGDTHGGQILLPFITSLVLKAMKRDRFPRGMHRLKDMTLYVNQGLGTIHIPVRMGAKAEMAYIKCMGVE